MHMDNIDQPLHLAERLREGNEGAAHALFHRYAVRLVRLAEQHLSRKVAGRVDAEDVVQSVFRTFFHHTARGDFRIDNSAQLWRLLVTITIRKAQAHARHHTAERRNPAAEVPGDEWLSRAVAHEPGPDEAVALVDLIETLLRGLPALYGQVLERRLRGETVAGIAPQLGVCRQTVYRALRLLQRRLAATAAEP
jgi:RNA polymerase sigma-70 factor (ECF subfamily)